MTTPLQFVCQWWLSYKRFFFLFKVDVESMVHFQFPGLVSNHAELLCTMKNALALLLLSPAPPPPPLHGMEGKVLLNYVWFLCWHCHASWISLWWSSTLWNVRHIFEWIMKSKQSITCSWTLFQSGWTETWWMSVINTTFFFLFFTTR